MVKRFFIFVNFSFSLFLRATHIHVYSHYNAATLLWFLLFCHALWYVLNLFPWFHSLSLIHSIVHCVPAVCMSKLLVSVIFHWIYSLNRTKKILKWKKKNLSWSLSPRKYLAFNVLKIGKFAIALLSFWQNVNKFKG